MSGFELEPIEKASREELARLQLERLQWSLRHAYENVPHYRRKFEAAGVKPSDCEHLEDLRRFPFMTKADLRDNYPYGRSEEHTSELQSHVNLVCRLLLEKKKK